MKSVNKYFLEDILCPLVGGADDDELLHLQNIDADNEEQVKTLLFKYILPYYLTSSTAYQSSFKLSLAYYLNNPKLDFERIIESNLLPMNTPTNPINLFIWIWELLFYSENYKSFSEENCIEINNQFVIR